MRRFKISAKCILEIILFLPLTFRSFSSLDPSEDARASYLYRQWVGLGLNDVRISNHTVLLSLPGSTPNTITDRSSHQCFLPYGTPCDQRELDDQEFSYAAYSASGSVQVLCRACLMTFVNQRSFHPPGCCYWSPPTHCLYRVVQLLLAAKVSMVKVIVKVKILAGTFRL